MINTGIMLPLKDEGILWFFGAVALCLGGAQLATALSALASLVAPLAAIIADRGVGASKYILDAAALDLILQMATAVLLIVAGIRLLYRPIGVRRLLTMWAIAAICEGGIRLFIQLSQDITALSGAAGSWPRGPMYVFVAGMSSVALVLKLLVVPSLVLVAMYLRCDAEK